MATHHYLITVEAREELPESGLRALKYLLFEATVEGLAGEELAVEGMVESVTVKRLEERGEVQWVNDAPYDEEDEERAGTR